MARRKLLYGSGRAQIELSGDAFDVFDAVLDKAAPETKRVLDAETERVAQFAEKTGGMEGYCIKEYAKALEIIPYTLAENAGLHPINIVTELRNAHAEGKKYAGINVRKGCITDIREENVLQPLLVTVSAITLATETVRMLLKIDDIVAVR